MLEVNVYLFFGKFVVQRAKIVIRIASSKYKCRFFESKCLARLEDVVDEFVIKQNIFKIFSA